MITTSYSDINELIKTLLNQIQTVLGEKLIGLYVFGSLATNDFEYDMSDIDLIAALRKNLNQEEFKMLQKMHTDIEVQYPYWKDRLEVGYLSLSHLKKPILNCPMALISPGEPFHFKKAGNDWIINRYILREKGLALFGPEPKTLVDPIPRMLLMKAVKELMQEWREWIKNIEIIRPRKYQAYMILTMCRAYYLMKNQDFPSKRQAALWMSKKLPQWAGLIQNAFNWRTNWRAENVGHEKTLPETLRFVNFVIDRILNSA